MIQDKKKKSDFSKVTCCTEVSSSALHIATQITPYNDMMDQNKTSKLEYHAHALRTVRSFNGKDNHSNSNSKSLIYHTLSTFFDILEMTSIWILENLVSNEGLEVNKSFFGFSLVFVHDSVQSTETLSSENF